MRFSLRNLFTTRKRIIPIAVHWYNCRLPSHEPRLGKNILVIILQPVESIAKESNKRSIVNRTYFVLKTILPNF